MAASEQIAASKRLEMARQALAGQEAAVSRDIVFAEFVHRHARFVFRVAHSLLRNQQDAEDVVQETFLKIYRSSAWERMEDERAFLARTAWRLALGRLPRASAALLDTGMASVEPGPEQSAIQADAHATLHRLIASLPEELRQPLALSSIEELSSREVAAVMGIPEGTVRTRVLRARQILKEKLIAWRGGRHESESR